MVNYFYVKKMVITVHSQSSPVADLVKIPVVTLPTSVCQARAREPPKTVRNWEQGAAAGHVLKDALVQLVRTSMERNVSIKRKNAKDLALPQLLSRRLLPCHPQPRVASGRPEFVQSFEICFWRSSISILNSKK